MFFAAVSWPMLPAARNIQQPLQKPPVYSPCARWFTAVAVFVAYVVCAVLVLVACTGTYCATFGIDDFGAPRQLALIIFALCIALAAPVVAYANVRR